MGNSSSTPTPPFNPHPFPPSYLDRLRSITPPLTLLLPSTTEYEKNRVAWNHDVVGHPSLMILPTETSQISLILPILNELCTTTSSFPLCISAGRHSHQCMENHSVMLDLQHFTSITVDVEGGTVTAGSGCRLAQLDGELHKYGLAVPVGTNPDTGIAGLSCNGGFGYLTRKYGMTIDSMISIEVVLADGRVVTANNQKDNEYNDLFWSHLGGGGNWGVVTKIQYKTYSLKETTHGAAVYLFRKPTIFGFPGADKMTDNWIKYAESTPNNIFSGMVFACNGPIIGTYAHLGKMDKGKKSEGDDKDNKDDDKDNSEEEAKQMMIDIKTKVAPPTIFTVKKGPYSHLPTSLQHMALKNQDSAYYYECAALLPTITSDIMKILLSATVSPACPNKDSAVVLFQTGGKMGEIPVESTAFAARNVKYWVLILGKWRDNDNAMRKKVREWVLKLQKEMQPYSVGSYNTVGKEEKEITEKAKEDDQETMNDPLPPSEIYFGSNLSRLRAVKSKYDKNNLFRKNKNIRPDGWTMPTDTMGEGKGQEKEQKQEESDKNKKEGGGEGSGEKKEDGKEKEKKETETQSGENNSEKLSTNASVPSSESTVKVVQVKEHISSSVSPSTADPTA